jgi:hypothetical protein
MAKFTPILGNISGKIAGLVYAFNRHGFYIRSFRAPTNPKTGAQTDARAIFARASSTYHSLASNAKGAWNTFASSFFRPKHAKIGSNPTGFNAYVSLKTEAENMAAQVAYNAVTSPMGALFTADFYTASQVPPDYMLASSIKDCQGKPLGLQLSLLNAYAYGALFTADFNLIGNTGVGTGGEGISFKDSVGNVPVGIAIYTSKPVLQSTSYIQAPEYSLLGCTSVIGDIDNWTESPSIQFEIEKAMNTLDRKSGLVPNVQVQATAFLIGQNGQSAYLGTCLFTPGTQAE